MELPACDWIDAVERERKLYPTPVTVRPSGSIDFVTRRKDRTEPTLTVTRRRVVSPLLPCERADREGFGLPDRRFTDPLPVYSTPRTTCESFVFRGSDSRCHRASQTRI